ncbi:regulator of chromosome condensation 1/beta-lactamase-inhibitor protein II [Circinella umbellata]|nr:regulator of chromosome condensation 1/beta-lactamase-inhibitor protein II [Circinella umbellata]
MKLLDLPLDILIDNILYNLDAQSLVHLACTNKTFSQLINDELLWKHRVFSDYNLPHDASFRHSGWKQLYSKLKDSVVYTWGENMDGRLGHPPQISAINLRIRNRYARQADVTAPKELVSLRGKGIVDIVSSGWGFHALDRHGHVWLWGRMHGDMVSRLSLGAALVSEPTLVQVPSHIQAISCGRSHAIALGRDGSVWHWDNYRVVQRIRVSNPIVQVAANWGYSSLLTSEGKLIRIEHPDMVTNAEDTLPDLMINAEANGVTLQSIEADAKKNSLPFKSIEKGDKIVQIAGLEKCTLVLTRYGRVFKIWTELADPLALTPATLTTELTKYGATEPELNEREGRNNRKMQRFVSAQFRNFAVYTADGKVLLGHQDHTAETEPEVLDQLQHDICKVSFGDYHSGALTNQGDLLTWGANSNGAIGHGEGGVFVEPKTIPEKISSLRDMFVFAIGFGGWQSSALAIPRDQISPSVK